MYMHHDIFKKCPMILPLKISEANLNPSHISDDTAKLSPH